MYLLEQMFALVLKMEPLAIVVLTLVQMALQMT
jgi:hypothetical protein